MLSATIKIKNIDYENTFIHIFPVVSEKLMAMDSKKMVIRLFQQLGDTALPVLLGLMSRLPENTKNELLVRSLNAYAPRLVDIMNKEFMKDKWGQCIQIEAISVDQQDDGMILKVGQIKVNYRALFETEQVKKAMGDRLGKYAGMARNAASMAGVLAPNTFERKDLELLWRDENKERIMALIYSALIKHRINLELGELQIMQTAKLPEVIAEESPRFTLSEEMETEIITALAGYLQDNIKPAQIAAS